MSAAWDSGEKRARRKRDDRRRAKGQGSVPRRRKSEPSPLPASRRFPPNQETPRKRGGRGGEHLEKEEKWGVEQPRDFEACVPERQRLAHISTCLGDSGSLTWQFFFTSQEGGERVGKTAEIPPECLRKKVYKVARGAREQDKTQYQVGRLKEKRKYAAEGGATFKRSPLNSIDTYYKDSLRRKKANAQTERRRQSHLKLEKAIQPSGGPER